MTLPSCFLSIWTNMFKKKLSPYRISRSISPGSIWFRKAFQKRITSNIIIFSRNKVIHSMISHRITCDMDFLILHSIVLQLPVSRKGVYLWEGLYAEKYGMFKSMFYKFLNTIVLRLYWKSCTYVYMIDLFIFID